MLPDFSVSRRHAVDPQGGRRLGRPGPDVDQRHPGQPAWRSKRACCKPGDRIKVGIFELAGRGGRASRATGGDATSLPTAGLPQAPRAVAVGTATIVRSLADFSAACGLDGKTSGEARVDKRKELDQAYSSKIFGFMTRLARLLIRSDSVDEVLSRVIDIAFEALPVDRGFILLLDETTGETVCELARIKDRVEFRPQSEVPVSQHDGRAGDARPRRAAHLRRALRPAAGRRRVDPHPPDPGGDVRAALVGREDHRRPARSTRRSTPAPFNEQDLDLLTALANYAAVAVERLRYAKTVEFERQVRSRLERYHSPAVIESIVKFTPSAAEPTVGG